MSNKIGAWERKYWKIETMRVVGGPENYYIQVETKDYGWRPLPWEKKYLDQALESNPKSVLNIPPNIRTTEQIVKAIKTKRDMSMHWYLTDEELERKEIQVAILTSRVPIFSKSSIDTIYNFKNVHRIILDYILEEDYFSNNIWLSKVGSDHVTLDIQKAFLKKDWHKRQLHPRFNNDDFLKTEWVRYMKIKHGSLDV